jgi:hypothetical protein
LCFYSGICISIFLRHFEETKLNMDLKEKDIYFSIFLFSSIFFLISRLFSKQKLLHVVRQKKSEVECLSCEMNDSIRRSNGSRKQCGSSDIFVRISVNIVFYSQKKT